MTQLLSVVCWRWGTRYGVEYANRLRSMLSRHLDLPHQLYVVTDDPTGLDGWIVPVMMWPPGDLGRARRLRMFGGVPGLFGSRILHLDIDCVIVRDITVLVARPEPFVMWSCMPAFRFAGNDKGGKVTTNSPDKVSAYNTSMILRDADTLPHLWHEYTTDPDGVEKRAKKASLWTAIYLQKKGTVHRLDPRDDDQAIVSLYARQMNPPPALWTEADGVYKWGRHGFQDRDRLPENARIVFANGSLGYSALDTKYAWVQEHWR